MRRKLLLTLTFAAPLLFYACAGNQPEASNAPAAASPAATPAAAQQLPTPAASQSQPVNASVEEVKLSAGGAGEAVVRLDIAPGFHVNANPASDKFYIPTELRAEAQEGITPGKPVYPSSVSRKLSFSEKPLAVYEGQAVIKLPLRADKTAAQGRHTFRAKVHVQPCNDQGCLPPRDIEAAIPVTIS
jgi:Disulphide bond corrector protein DsbC